MFVALKNWRERLKHQGNDGDHRLLADAEHALAQDGRGSADLLRIFRTAALAPDLPQAGALSLPPLGAQFVNAEPLSTEQNLSIMASVERGTAHRKQRGS